MISPILITGLTGSGKTTLLQYLQLRGEQIIDLENLAQHSGSLFGGFNRSFISSQNDFEQMLWHNFQQIDEKRLVFTEFKGKTLGELIIPPWFLDFQLSAAQLFIDTPFALRLHHILQEYQHISIEQFRESFEKIRNRLTTTQKELANSALQENNKKQFIEIMIEYFDNSSRYKNLKSAANFSIKVKKLIDFEKIYQEILNLDLYKKEKL